MTSAHEKYPKQVILIVDDSPENIDVLGELLRHDYTIKAVTNGPKALEIATSTSPAPDLILLDVMMPGMDGYEVCRRLKADKVTRNIPIIFVTTLDEMEDEEYGLKLGAVDYIKKPFSSPIVRARVYSHLQLKYHQDHLQSLVRERTRELEQVKGATIESMAVLAEFRDPETGGHIHRTKHYIRILAHHLKNHLNYRDYLGTETITLLYESAPLHDIGKIGIPDSILLKPGKLTTEEFEEMKKHTIYGYDAIKATEKKLGHQLSFLRYAGEIAYTHHEKWDGNGYPCGLRGDEIPISGRLMAVADVYDALISKRVYKPLFPHRKAVEIITEGCGTQFDPEIVIAFLEKAEQFHQVAMKFADFAAMREPLAN